MNMSTTRQLLLAALLGSAVTGPAFAQSEPTAYCQAMSDKYTRYVQNTENTRRVSQPPVAVSDAMSKCKTDSAHAIPVLEKALQDAKVDLPARN
jgi:hypothetical protein